MGNAAGGMEGAAARESRDPRAPGPAAVSAAAAATPTRPPPPARQPMPAADELEERFSRVLVSPGEAAVLPGLFSAFPPPPSPPPPASFPSPRRGPSPPVAHGDCQRDAPSSALPARVTLFSAPGMLCSRGDGPGAGSA